MPGQVVDHITLKSPDWMSDSELLTAAFLANQLANGRISGLSHRVKKLFEDLADELEKLAESRDLDWLAFGVPAVVDALDSADGTG